MKLTILSNRLAVCRLDAKASIPAWAFSGSFHSIVRTAKELSIVCADDAVPDGTQAQRGWRCLEVAGPLDFALTGILFRLLHPLAMAEVSIFALSTYDTDYIMVKEETLAAAVATLKQAGHEISP